MNAEPEPEELEGEQREGEEMTAGGVLLPPRDRSGTPEPREEALTEEGEEAEETELATGRSTDERGQPRSVKPPPAPSRSQIEED